MSLSESGLAQSRSIAWGRHRQECLHALRNIPYGPEWRDAALAELDEATRLVTDLRSTYNSYAPILRLPNEILALVFVILQSIWEPRHATNLGWLNATFVCRSWRLAALRMASLWTRPPLHLGKEWTRTFLELARSLPISLDILARGTIQYNDMAFETLLSLKDYFETSSCSHVRWLNLSLDWDGAEWNAYMLPPSLFAPLWSLTLSHWLLLKGGARFWDCLPSTLQELVLLGIPSDCEEEPGAETITGLIPLLSRSTRLSKLVIYHSFLDILELPERLDLPALRDLTIGATSQDCLRLLKALDNPCEIQKLALEFGHWDPGDIDGILQFMQQSSVTTTEKPFTSLGIGRVGDFFVVAANRESNPADAIERMFRVKSALLESEVIQDISLCIEMQDVGSSLDSYLCLIPSLHPLGFSCVRTLHIHNILLPTKRTLCHLGAMRAVEEMCLAGPGMHTVLVALGRSVNAEQEEGHFPKLARKAADLIFPRLRRLRVERVDFGVLCEDAYCLAATVAQTFGLALVVRAPLGSAIQTMHLVKCVVGETDLELWAQAMEVTMDGCPVERRE
ncbi:unnamed protein product [Peniophora sp. CBMAI 1063]|nr:unnamed protein product [Peniophora sp. CBMAI 1063]